MKKKKKEKKKAIWVYWYNWFPGNVTIYFLLLAYRLYLGLFDYLACDGSMYSIWRYITIKKNICPLFLFRLQTSDFSRINGKRMRLSSRISSSHNWCNLRFLFFFFPFLFLCCCSKLEVFFFSCSRNSLHVHCGAQQQAQKVMRHSKAPEVVWWLLWFK